MFDWQNENDPVRDHIKTILIERKQTVAVAESVTAGLLQVRLSLAENAREFFQGGITAYNVTHAGWGILFASHTVTNSLYLLKIKKYGN